MREYSTAKCALQKALALQVVQIFANCDHAHRKPVGQLADIQITGLFEQVEYLLTALCCFHTLEMLT